MYVCKAENMAIWKARTGKKSSNQSYIYYFDVESARFGMGVIKRGRSRRLTPSQLNPPNIWSSKSFRKVLIFVKKQRTLQN